MIENSLPETESSESSSDEPKPVEETAAEAPTESNTEENSSTEVSETSSEEAAPSEETPSAEETTSESAPEEEPAEPKREFKPAINPEMAKARPSLVGGAADPVATETKEDAEAKPVPSHAPSGTEIPAPKEAVEIPDDADLDSQMEAEIAAAMSTGELDAAATTESAPADPTADVAVPNEEELQPGSRLNGTVESVRDENIVLHLGYRMSGLLLAKNLDEKKIPKVGDKVDVVVDRIDEEEGVILLNLPAGMKKVEGNWDALIEGQIVECLVTKTNKGGLDVTVSGLRGFLPASQVSLGFVDDMEKLVGQKLKVKVIDIKPAKKNLVVSRKAIEIEERAELAQSVWETLSVGEERTGTVKTIKDYGAFVDIGGVDGLVHVAEMSWQRIKNPAEILKQGQQIQVKIKSLDPAKKKIGLSMKELMSDPWQHVDTRFAKGTEVTGEVCRITDFGAFVTLDEGIDGLIHISQLDHKRVNTVHEVLKVGEEVTVQVTEVNKNKRRISLSRKALTVDPKKIEAEAAAAANEKRIKELQERRTEPLKGGTGSEGGGGLFGNPKDFT